MNARKEHDSDDVTTGVNYELMLYIQVGGKSRV